MDYQKTLNLPQTAFSMKANLAQNEPNFLNRWEQDGLYLKIRQESKGKKSYILHDGPPYANGNIHIGHALNKILKDMIIKMKTMQGLDCHYIPGWDCHGLPIEHQLLKEIKKKKSEVDPLEFRKRAHNYAMKYVGIQREEFKRLGVFGDWENPYLTLSSEYEYWILNSFSRLAKRGYIYRGLKPVNWCSYCETALAEAEVEYEDHTSPSIFVRFKVNNPEVLRGVPREKPLFLLIWTTTPWTLLANVAVAVHHSYRYALVDIGGEFLIMEESLVDKVTPLCSVTQPVEKFLNPKPTIYETIHRDISGSELKKLVYTHPFGIKKNCRVITVDYVTKEDGTGLVHTAPGHGQEDYDAGVAHKLDILMPVDDRGIFTKEAGAFAGEHVFKANEKIIDDLQARGLLFSRGNVTHSYPHCWRCKHLIIFRATKQWFLKIDHLNLRGHLKDVIKNQIQWIPAAGEERILGMVVTRPDWCLSRQRHWGVPIPAVICQGCKGEYKLFPEVVDYFAQLVKDQGTDLWFEKDIKELIPEGFRCPDCNESQLEKTYDILDVWFDSGVSHQAVISPMLRRDIPVDLYLEGSDQHRGWFQSSLIPAMALEGKPPFRAVLTHGFVVDGQGRKMSKSLGNVISPQDVIKNYGADILRLWVASSNYHEDIRLSKEILDRLIDAYRKIRNTARFLLGNLSDFDPLTHQLPYEQLWEIDQWALFRLYEVMEGIKAAYNDYEFPKVYKFIYSFCNEDLSSFYLDILKDRLYTFAHSSLERRSAQSVLFHILNHLVRALAPVLTFTAEEIYQRMPKDNNTREIKSVHLLDWIEIPKQWMNPRIAEKFKALIEIRPFVSKGLDEKRRLGEIGSSLEAKVIFETASPQDLSHLGELEDILPTMFIVSQVEIRQVKDVPEGVSDSFAKTRIAIERAEGEKCSRCWNYSPWVGKDHKHPDLCQRCLKVIKQLF